jgi:hypothetical protein
MSTQSKPPGDSQQLERFIGRVLGQQPLRQAPSSLELRVMQELALRTSRPWWLQGFGRWPWVARLLFLPLGLGLVQLSFTATSRLSSLWQSLQHSAPVSTAQSGLQLLSNFGQAVQSLGNVVTHEIPQIWIYGGAAVALLLYAAMFGLGAAAFRTLVVSTEPVR